MKALPHWSPELHMYLISKSYSLGESCYGSCWSNINGALKKLSNSKIRKFEAFKRLKSWGTLISLAGSVKLRSNRKYIPNLSNLYTKEKKGEKIGTQWFPSLCPITMRSLAFLVLASSMGLHSPSSQCKDKWWLWCKLGWRLSTRNCSSMPNKCINCNDRAWK